MHLGHWSFMGQNLSSDYLSLFEIHQRSALCEIVASQGRRDLSSISSSSGGDGDQKRGSGGKGQRRKQRETGGAE